MGDFRPARPSMQVPELTVTTASRLARVALANVSTEYPNKPDHVLGSPDDLRASRELHPAFYGSYDWHSCVHMHWLLARVARLVPALPERAAIVRTFDAHFAPEAIAAECAYLARPHARSFERTYGWAWLLELARELGQGDDADSRRWSRAIAPLAAAFAARWRDWLARARYPIRHGTHPNSAFGLALAIDYARAAQERALEDACVSRALAWFGGDRDAPAAWEPSGADFLSPALMEADLMRRVLPHERYGAWLAAFLPGLAHGEPRALFAPAEATDRSDPQIVHLDGLNLSRAWCMRGIANALPPGDARAAVLRDASQRHVATGMEGLESGDYMGAHWLATFAVLAMTE
ncbi:hypothetical protein BURK1_03492 [Burkholderiales bacterium]|nr:hypothetical protein BURK1_03492 [Burkholderiales bacterium]